MGVRHQVTPLTREQFDRLDPAAVRRLQGWSEETLAEWGHCGMLAERNELVVGWLTMAPAAYVPHTGVFATISFGTDAAVLLSVAVADDWVRQGVGRQLVRAAAADLVERRIAGLEAVGRPGNHNGNGIGIGAGGLPEGWLTAVGFRLVRDHPLSPRYRMDLNSTVRWRPDLSAAWSRVRGLVVPATPPEPARYRADFSTDPPDQLLAGHR